MLKQRPFLTTNEDNIMKNEFTEENNNPKLKKPI